MFRLLPLLLFLLAALPVAAQFPATCDKDKSCVGNALTIDVTSGKGAQYVDVDFEAGAARFTTALTFEAWISPSPQQGKRQFVAGHWGPNRDNNDVWVVYIEGETITFALSPEGSYQGDADNTVASTTVSGLYTRGWTHVAAIFDGSAAEARIYIDGVERVRRSSTTNPITRLKRPESPQLPLQIAACNSLFDDTTRFRSFKGQIDEVRLWNVARSEQEIRCGHIRSLNGNESGLILYYRCNEGSSTQTLCDATGNGYVGLMRSGAHCERSDRRIVVPYAVSPASINGSLYCTSDTTFTFTVTDTSYCGNDVAFRMVGADAGLFSVSPRNATLSTNQPVTVTVTARATVIGTINARLRISSSDRCGAQIEVPITLQRRTELDYSKGRLDLDSLYIGCIERSYTEDTLEICNRTGRPMRIDAAALSIGRYFTFRSADPSQGLPYTIPNGGCWRAIVRMTEADSTETVYDTLRITSDDRCPGSGIIPIVGRTQEVLAIRDVSFRNAVEAMNFGSVCPGQISDVRLYQWRNMVGEQIEIDTIIFTNPNFFGRRTLFPVLLEPDIAYQATYIRFRPDQPGVQTGEARFICRYRGCTIVKTISLQGRGISVDVRFNTQVVGFGNVTIGQSARRSAEVENVGDETRQMSAYLKQGDVFRIVANQRFSITPGGRIQIELEFRPREAITYVDTLCIFDEQCYQTICIPVTGTGVFEALSFSPSYLRMENVIGCRCRVDTLEVGNISGSGVTVSSARLVDPVGAGKIRAIGGMPSGALANGSSFRYVIEYCPADLQNDRADEAFVELQLSNGETYQVLIRATSVVPRLYVTDLTVFGNVEVGWRRRDRILAENASSVPITISTPPTLPGGYSVISTTPALPVTLAPRDSLWVEVEFAPTAEIAYDGEITISSSDPCDLSWSGGIRGRGEIVRLEVPVSFINYGLIKPCDCSVRQIPLPNRSQYIPITIDSIWIDGAGVASPRPAVFTWRSRQTGGATLPYTLDPQASDTIDISFCPNIPSTPQNILSNATIHIAARTSAWQQTFETVLSGRRELNFQPSVTKVQFPDTRVDTSARPIPVTITVPDAFQNPSGDSIVITDITFVPDQRVFSVSDTGNRPFPWVIPRGKPFTFFVNFYPRAPRDYIARMHMRTSYPCDGADTTILVCGSGFAPAFGMQMAFDTALVGLDTFRLTTCDTLEVPVMISRAIPQPTIDIAFRVGYDSTALRLLDIRSPWTTTATVVDTGDGARCLLKNARNAQAGEIAWLRFVVRGGAAQFPLTLDEIDFDSDSLVFFKIVAGVDRAWVIIDEPMIAVSKLAEYDTVNLKSCADRVVTVWNPGLIPITFDSLGGLPPGHRVTASTRPLPAVLQPGDSVDLTVTFCPWIEAEYRSTYSAISNDPCPIADTGTMHSVGYAPPYPMQLLIGVDPLETVTLGGTIADTVELPIGIDRDCPQSPLDITFSLDYNRRALQFIDVRSTYSPGANGTELGGGVRIRLPDCENIVAGEIARIRFVVAVPDTVTSPMLLIPEPFTSDSVFWVKLDPPITTGDTGEVRVDPRCNISRLAFREGANKLATPTPNPTRGRVAVEAELLEDVPTRLVLYNVAGQEILRLIDSPTPFAGGRYRFEFTTTDLPSGDYFLVLETPRFRASERLRVER